MPCNALFILLEMILLQRVQGYSPHPPLWILWFVFPASKRTEDSEFPLLWPAPFCSVREAVPVEESFCCHPVEVTSVRLRGPRDHG